MVASKFSLGRGVLYVAMTLASLLMLFPFYNLLIQSFATPLAISQQTVYLIPTSFDLTSYQLLFAGTMMGNSLVISVIVTVLGTSLNLFLTVLTGYVLAKKEIPGVRVILVFIVVTMVFNGGLVPYYLTVLGLGLKNSLLVLILPTALDTFFLLIAISFFKTVPPSLEESARIDGASEYRILFQIVAPVSMPMIAAVGLFYAVARWNEWWLAMLFIDDLKLQPMQYVLRQLITQITSVMDSSIGAALADQMRNGVYPTGLKMAGVVVTTLPILCVYPFIQKHFNGGVMLGSIKG